VARSAAKRRQQRSEAELQPVVEWSRTERSGGRPLRIVLGLLARVLPASTTSALSPSSNFIRVKTASWFAGLPTSEISTSFRPVTVALLSSSLVVTFPPMLNPL
jgi:hypothetical protein